MKRFRCFFLAVGICIFCVSTASAQQDPGFVPFWDDSLNLIDSLIFQTADGILVIDASTTGGNPLLNRDLQVLGTLTKGAGMFKIDHPLDLENKYLSHSFVESPNMMNVYDGMVVLDSRGQACLPEWFEGLNRARSTPVYRQ
jgi:hypothetical protein